MQDRVSDILAQRARLESGAGVAIFFSVLFHATLTAIAGWSAWHRASTQATPVMMIRFAHAQPAPELTSVAPPPAAAIAPAPKPVEKPKPIDKKKFALPSEFGKSTKKAAMEPPPATRYPPPALAPPAAPAATTTTPEVPLGGAGVTGLEGGDFPYPLYIEQMKRLIGGHWTRPNSGDQSTATIYFVIDRDGTIHDVKQEIASGSGLYDRAALRAVLESSPLPPLPFGYNGTFLGVHLKFR
jgi:TonB family protein